MALGRAWILFENRKNSKPEKYLTAKRAARPSGSPQRPVHLGMLMGRHFQPKNVHLSKEDIAKGSVLKEIDAFLPIPG
jgi:hypothetical protein